VRSQCDRPARIVAHGREATAPYLTTIEGPSERHKTHKLKGAHSFPPPRRRQRGSLIISSRRQRRSAARQASD